jgi:hypothetical protein
VEPLVGCSFVAKLKKTLQHTIPAIRLAFSFVLNRPACIEPLSPVAEPGIELSRVEQISSNFFLGQKITCNQQKMVQTDAFVIFHRVEVQTD